MARRYLIPGDFANATEWSRRALTTAEGMVAAEPDYASARINAMSSWPVLLEALSKSGSREEHYAARVKR